MLDQDDQYYKELPFTLPEQQSKPNFIIFGTGLQQCLLAAYFSKMQLKPGLVLDMQRSYGSCLKTITIKQLFALNSQKVKVALYDFIKIPQFTQRNKNFQEETIEKKLHRGYSIDLQPNFFFASSIACQMLKQADMDKYMDFTLTHSILHYDGKGFKNVPLSKGKIFQSKDLGLLEKKTLLNTFHSLIQIYNKYMNVVENQNSTKQFDKEFGNVDQKLYSQFLASKNDHFFKFLEKITKGSKKILDYMTYILCNYQYTYKKQLPDHAKSDFTLSEFIKRFGKFVKSCGVYGQSPYMYVNNGIGDVPQAFSRIASIYQTTYILHPKIEITSISQQKESQTIKVSTNLLPGKHIETKKVYFGPTCYNLKYGSFEEYSIQHTLRVILVCQKIGNEQQCPAIVYLVDLKHNQNPVYLFIFDSSSHTCPEPTIIYQFETILEKNDVSSYKDKVESYLQVLSVERGQNFRSSIKYLACYIREKRYPKKQKKQNENFAESSNFQVLRDHSGIDLDSHFINFQSIIGEKDNYFKKQGAENATFYDQWQGGDETVGLIQRLEAIDLKNEKSHEDKHEDNNQDQNKDLDKKGRDEDKNQKGESLEQEISNQVQPIKEAKINQDGDCIDSQVKVKIEGEKPIQKQKQVSSYKQTIAYKQAQPQPQKQTQKQTEKQRQKQTQMQKQKEQNQERGENTQKETGSSSQTN